VIVNGKFAQFGSRLMVQVSDMLLAQFAENFGAAAAALPGPPTSAAAAAPASMPASSAPVSAPASPVPSAAPAQAHEINALAIAWRLVKGWFAGVFGKRSA
jgi:uncharacterized protein